MKKLTPNLAVTHIPTTVSYYCNVLGFDLRMLVDETMQGFEDTTIDPSKTYIWAMVGHGDVEIMFQLKSNLEKEIGPLPAAPVLSGTVYMETDDADTYYDRIKDQAVIHKKPDTAWYGMREFYVKDPDGYLLGFASMKASS